MVFYTLQDCLNVCARDVCINMDGRGMGAYMIVTSMNVPKYLSGPPTFQSTTVSFHFQGHFLLLSFCPCISTRPGNTREPALQVPEACRMPPAASLSSSPGEVSTPGGIINPLPVPAWRPSFLERSQSCRTDRCTGLTGGFPVLLHARRQDLN